MIYQFSLYFLDNFIFDLILRILAIFLCPIYKSDFWILFVSVFLISKKDKNFMSQNLSIQKGKANQNSQQGSGCIFPYPALWRHGPWRTNHVEWHLATDLTKSSSGASNLLRQQSYLTTVSETFPFYIQLCDQWNHLISSVLWLLI